VRSNKDIFYCWSHGWDTGHNSNQCQRQANGHLTHTRLHVNNNGNPRFSERIAAPSSVGLIGQAKARAMAGMQPQANAMPVMQQPTAQFQQPAMQQQMQPQHFQQQQNMMRPIMQPIVQQQQQQQPQWAMNANGTMVQPTQAYMSNHVGMQNMGYYP
jgi:FtsZ-interacting cell division protein ZipA